MVQTQKTPSKKENPLTSILLNVVVPAVILSVLSKEKYLGPVYALMIALAFPLIYGIWDLCKRRKWNFFSLIGLISVLLTGGLGLMKTEPIWFALKEASIPLVFGGAILGSLRTRKPLAKLLLLNPELVDVTKLENSLREQNKENEFQTLIVNSTLMLAVAMLISSLLNFILSLFFLHGKEGGSEEYIASIGTLTWVSFLVIGLPILAMLFYALRYLLLGVKGLTGLKVDDLLLPR